MMSVIKLTINVLNITNLIKKEKIKNFNKKNQNGFSLIELMVVVAIISFLAIGAVTFFSGGIRSWIRGDQQLKSQREARQVMESVVREIRHARNITDGDSKSITLNIPDFENNIEDVVTVSYSWSGTEWEPIYRKGNPMNIDNVLDLTFEYYKYSDSNTPISTPVSDDDKDKVNKVHISLQVDTDKDNNPDIVLNSDVELRNFGLEIIE
jgi:prepilin-type N-terminal cleavage/methylation domain-containing protein